MDFSAGKLSEKRERNLGQNFCNKREVGEKYFQLNSEDMWILRQVPSLALSSHSPFAFFAYIQLLMLKKEEAVCVLEDRPERCTRLGKIDRNGLVTRESDKLDWEIHI